MDKTEQERLALEAMIEHIRLLSAEMKVLAAEHAHQKLAERLGERQENLENIFKDFMNYLTDEDIKNISQILLIDKEIEIMVEDYQQKVREAFEKNKKSLKAHKAYQDTNKHK